MKFFCSSCGVRIECDPSCAGSVASCPSCNALVMVPASRSTTLPPGEEADSGQQPDSSRYDSREADLVAPDSVAHGASRPPGGALVIAGQVFLFVPLFFVLVCAATGVGAAPRSLLVSGLTIDEFGQQLFFGLLGMTIFLFVAYAILLGYRYFDRCRRNEFVFEYPGAFGRSIRPTEAVSVGFFCLGMLCGATAGLLSIPAVSHLLIIAGGIAFACSLDRTRQRKVHKKLNSVTKKAPTKVHS